MSERISRIVYRALDNAVENGHAPATLSVSEWTDDLLAFDADLEGAAYQDVYSNVLAWVLTKGKSK